MASCVPRFGSKAFPAVLGLVTVLLLATPIAAQPRSGSPGRGERGVALGARGGYDLHNSAWVLGAQSHIVLDPWRFIDVMPGAQVEFLTGLTEWQIDADVAVVPRPGLYVGGGAAFRNTVRGTSEQRETLTGFSVFVGLRQPLARRSASTQLEFRWVFVDDFRPQVLTLGVNFPLVSF